MKKIIYIIFTLQCVVSECDYAQNLVPNYSFETYYNCPNYYSYLYYASPWFQPSIDLGTTTKSCSSDLYNSCCTTGEVHTPLNSLGYQLPRTGNGYAGIYCSADTINLREYIETKLLSNLIADKMYCVEFYISLADNCKQAISNIGIYFSIDSLLDTSSGKAIEYIVPQIENSTHNILGDKNNWMLVSGIFKAVGGENFITIGNFHNPFNTNIQNVSGGISNLTYYYIDDISVKQVPDSTEIAGKDTTLCRATDVKIGSKPIYGFKYSWSPGKNLSDSTIAQPVASVLKTTDFILTIIDTTQASNNCFAKITDKVKITIIDCDGSFIQLPNIFTPNNDGTNDIFKITSENITAFNLKIYNRWGILIKELKDANEAWDGLTSAGLECTDGVYFYILIARGIDDKVYNEKRFVQLIR